MLPPGPPAVDLRALCKLFGKTVALGHVSLQIRPGEFFTLLGPSGCGKTTLLRLIAGFEAPDEGEIALFGEPIGNLPPHRRSVNTVFQHYALFPHLTVAQNVAFGLEMLGRKNIGQAVADALALVQMSGFADRKPAQLSGGQQQRVALARALAPNPKVLLLDEPLSALDLKLRHAMRAELKTLQRETGVTFIFVTHDQEEALTMSDRIAVMSTGQVRQVGTPAEVYERPADRFVADFVGRTNFLEGSVSALTPEEAEVTLLDGSVLRLEPLPTLTLGEPVTVFVRPEKIGLHPATEGAALCGTVLDLMYLGTDTSYRVGLAGGGVLEVRTPNTLAGLPRFGPDARVAVDIAPGAARLLKA